MPDQPEIRAVLCFAVATGNILLIRKLRGLGAGKINGPGGKIDPGETPLQAAIRETEEEIGATPLGLREMGELWFRFADGMRLHCVVFRADGITGEPRDTDEALPFWCPTGAIPYSEMWADDIDWLPLLLEGRRFEGRYLFEGDSMKEREIRILPG